MSFIKGLIQKKKEKVEQKPHKLYGAVYSTCTRRVLMTAFELGIEIEVVMTDLLKGDHKSPAHLARQPFGQIPAFEDADDGTMVF
jgi:glutathione S-transferase